MENNENYGGRWEQEGRPPEDPDLMLTRKAHRLAALVRTYYAHAAKDGGAIDPLRGQGRVLALLAMKPETTQRELQFLLDMKQQSLSELLAKLEAKGFVERQKSAEDGRVTIVRLTQEGAAAAPNPGEKPRVEGAYACLDAEAREQFEQSIDAVIASLKEKVGDVHERGHGPHGRGPRECGGEEGEQKRHRHGKMGHGGRVVPADAPGFPFTGAPQGRGHGGGRGGHGGGHGGRGGRGGMGPGCGGRY